MSALRIYFAVPGHYTIGPEFDTFAAAEAHAKAKIRHITGCGDDAFTRAFVDVREQDATGDRSVHRVEVFLMDAEKSAAPETQPGTLYRTTAGRQS